MPLLGMTTAQAKLARWLIRAAGETIPAAVAWLAADLTGNVAAPETLEWRRFVLRWTRSTPAGTVEDFAQFKLDLLNITSDELDVTWTDADNAAVRALFNTFNVALSTYAANNQTSADLRAYRVRFNPVPDLLRPFADTGPPTYVSPMAQNWSATPGMPYQVAPTVTMRTGWAKHWGRAYLPTPGITHLDTNGRFTSAYRTGVGGLWKTMLGGLHDAGFYPVIPVGQVNKEPFHALLGVSAIVVDDVPDVQRRRRPKMAAVRSVI